MIKCFWHPSLSDDPGRKDPPLLVAAVMAGISMPPAASAHHVSYDVQLLADAAHTYIVGAWQEIGGDICDHAPFAPVICYCVAGGRGVYHRGDEHNGNYDADWTGASIWFTLWIPLLGVGNAYGVNGIGIEVSEC